MPDRSNMRVVQTTDKENRQAFKARLVERITAQEEVTLPLASTNHIPVGSLVWHPDFGPCVVDSVSLAENTIVLTTETLGNVSMVLSAVHSKLRPVNESEAPEPAKPFTVMVEKPKQEKVADDPALQVTLPTIYQIFSPAEQYRYLTTELHFTPEKASAFIFDNSPYEITWEALKPADIVERTPEVHSVVQPAEVPASSPPGVLSLPTIFKSFSQRDQVAFLRNTKQLTWDEVNDAGYGALNLIYTDKPEAHRPYVRPVIEEVEIKSTVAEVIPPKTQLNLASSFNNLTRWSQKLHLTNKHQLTPEQAESFLDGDRDNFEVIWD